VIQWTLISNNTTDGTRTASAQATFEPKCSEETPRTQPIGIFVTCIERRDSTYDAVFGYENDNPVAESIPVGLANSFAPEPIDRGQPETFLPGRNVQAVTVRGIPADQALTWTLAYEGTRETSSTVGSTATATLASPSCSPPLPPTPPPPNPPTPIPPPNPKPPDPPGPKPPVPPRPLGVFASCVLRLGATYTAVFGYDNLNVGDVIIPIGSHNYIRPGANDRGQPEIFQPGLVSAAFAVRGVPIRQTLRWSVTFGDETREATASADLPQKCETTPPGPLADLKVTKSVKPGVVRIGDRVVFTIVAKNVGRRPMRGVVITDLLHGGRLEILSAATTLGSCRVAAAAAGHRVSCGRGTLAPGESATVQIAVRAVRAGRSPDLATTLFRHSLDATPKNNVAGASVVIRAGPHAARKPKVTG
jgi:uncharacterized repeat protein (TIGR01451 family)